MRASQLRLLPVSAAIAAGAALVPVAAVAAVAEPGTPASVVHQEVPVAHQQVIAEEPSPAPPLWLLLLLAPVLVGGAVGVGVTLRRLR